MDPIFPPRRELGRTGFQATQLGIGDLADRNVPLEQCVATVHRAMDAGLNVIDTAPGYEDGYSEEILARALQGRRDGMFVIDKIDFHDQPVLPQIEASLSRMRLDYIDAMVFHGINALDDWPKRIAVGGGMEQLREARQQGKIRYCGISSHHPGVLRKAISSGVCDIVLFPIGPFADLRYEKEILPLAKQHRVGTVCFKTFGAGKLLCDTQGYGRPLEHRPRGKASSGGSDEIRRDLPHLTVEQCLHYTLTIDPDVALLGLSFPNEQDVAFRAAQDFEPMSPEALANIRTEALHAIRGKGPAWWNPPVGE